LFSQLELDWSLRLPLQHHGTSRYSVALRYVTDAQAHEIAATELAVQREIEERELPSSLGELQANADCPDLLEAQRWLLAHELALVPGRLLHCNRIGQRPERVPN